LLPRCVHLTAASPLIADAYEQRYDQRPATVLNTFPISEAPAAPVETPYSRGVGPPTLYWFSQTVGPGRGLEAVVAAMGRMTLPVELHLRGIPTAGYRESLTAYAETHGCPGSRVIWLPPAEPDDMVRLAAGHDLGLALELTSPPNRAICLTNKAFTYLLAGVPVALSRTPAQEWLGAEIADAGLVVDLDDSMALAARLESVLADRGRLARCRASAWRRGRERFNWDLEQDVFLTSVATAIRSRTRSRHDHPCASS
jgi:glycosyltransferase involved in cell wall biosynthesis